MIDTRLRTYRNRGRFLVFAVIMMFSLLPSGMAQTAGAGIPDEQKAVLCSLEDSFSYIAQRVEPGVVSITSVQRVSSPMIPGRNTGTSELDKLLKDLFKGSVSDRLRMPELWHGTAAEESVTAEGSGTIVRRQGDKFYIFTNYHVVEDAYRVAVRLTDGSELNGKVAGIDPVTDLAVVEISSTTLTDRNVVPLGDSDSVKVGAWALAVGSPYGFEHTLTVGVVSAVQRELSDEETDYPDLIQTDAAINKGNSGGPLIDVEGRVIGINAAIASPTGGSIGLGFAIPINTAKAILDDLITEGRVIRGWLGAGIQDLTPVLQEYYNVKGGVLVASVIPKGPASDAGLRSEDIVSGVGEEPVGGVRDLQRVISGTAPGTDVRMDVLRGGAKQSVTVRIGLSPSTPKSRPAPSVLPSGPGIRVRTLSKDMADRIGMEGVKGVLVVNVTPGTVAEAAGLEEGDIIVSFGRKPVTSDRDFSDALGQAKAGDIIVLKVLRKDKDSARFIGFHKE